MAVKEIDGREIIWAPQAGSQELFMGCPLFEVLYSGTRGPGKTDALIMSFCQHVDKGYGEAWTGIIFRETYPQLGDVIKKSKKWIKKIWPGAKYNESAKTWKFPGGETLLFRHARTEDDYWNYHGHEYPFIGWEELTNWASPALYKRMMSCCRSSKMGLPRMYRATTNPYGKGHNWIKHRFNLPGGIMVPIKNDNAEYDDEFKDIEVTGEERYRICIHGELRENKILLAADPGYINTLKMAAKNKTELEAWLRGSWDIVSGGMFDDVWDLKTHAVPRFILPHSWKIRRSFDWGSSKPFSVGWWAESDGCDISITSRDGSKVLRKSTVRGDVFRIAEWYGFTGEPNEGLRMLATDISKGIVERELRWGYHGKVKPGPADTSIWTVENGMCIATDMAKKVRLSNGKQYKGITWTRADKSPGSRKNGWETIRKMLGNAKRKDGLPREYPGVFIFENCLQFIRTVPVLSRDDKDPDDVNTDLEDHIADETRYYLRSMNNRAKSFQTSGNH